MASPVKPNDLCSLVPTVSSDPCEAFRRIFFTIPKLICDFLNWMLNPDGSIKESFVAELRAMPVGAVIPYSGINPPSGYLLADGSAVSRTTYPALFTVCGTMYGVGDGSTTFNLPNLVRRFPLGLDRSTSDFQIGNSGGEEEVVLAGAELAHRHDTGRFSAADNDDVLLIIPPLIDQLESHPNSEGEAVRGVAGDSGSYMPSTMVPNSYTTRTGLGYNDEDNPASGHNNMPPYLCLNFIIKY